MKSILDYPYYITSDLPNFSPLEFNNKFVVIPHESNPVTLCIKSTPDIILPH
jgi:hypothetical protein